jgi:hypothetical protein
LDFPDKRLILLVFIAGFLATGCSGTIFKKFSIDDTPPNSISLDARQRLIIVTDKGGPASDDDGKPLQQNRVVCAEPSPDAFMALVASGGADLTIGKKEFGGRGSMAESVGALGRRTQTIQLLRDVLYRSCEAYMNGAIDKNEYRRIMAAYDELLITLVAIESLGSTNKDTLPQIGGEATIKEGEKEKEATANTSAENKSKVNSSSTIGAPDAQLIHEIVKNYYCFQLGMKQMFYSNNSKNISQQVLKALCE